MAKLKSSHHWQQFKRKGDDDSKDIMKNSKIYKERK